MTESEFNMTHRALAEELAAASIKDAVGGMPAEAVRFGQHQAILHALLDLTDNVKKLTKILNGVRRWE